MASLVGHLLPSAHKIGKSMYDCDFGRVLNEPHPSFCSDIILICHCGCTSGSSVEMSSSITFVD